MNTITYSMIKDINISCNYEHTICLNNEYSNIVLVEC